MAEFAPLFPLETQFQAKDGRNNTAGWLKVFLAGTDDPAVTYSDYNGTRNPEKIVLDNNGRAIIICDKEQGYRLEVYDARGMLLWTEEPVFCSGTGGAGMAMTEIVSTDGSIDVQKNTAGGVTQFDIGLAPGDSPEFLEWSTGFRGNMTYGSAKVPNYSAGTMSFDQYGVMVYKDRYYHITNKFFIKPLGTGTNYETFEVALMLRNPADGSAISVEVRKWDIDTSLTDEVQVEMSFDLTPSQDGELYWEFYNSLPKFQSTDAWIQIHRVYSGINAVPDTCATKQWVSANYIPQSASGDFQAKSGMSAYVPYSAIEGDGGAISGINGSAISGMVDTSMVIPFSALEYNSSGEISAISGSAIGGQVDSSQFMPVSASGDLIAYSALEYSGGQITGISGSSIGYGIDPSQFLPASASGSFYPYSGNPSGFLTAHQDISTKLDVTAFTSYSANLDSALGDEFDQIHSSLDDKLDKTAFTGYTATALTSIENDVSSISAAVSGLTGTYVEQSAFNDYSAGVDSALADKADASSMTSYMPYSSLGYSGTVITGIDGSAIGGQFDSSQFLPTSASGDFYPMTGNPSGFTTTSYVDSSVSGKADASALSGYQPTGDYAYNSSLSSKLDSTAFSTVSGTFLTSVNLPISGEEWTDSANYGIHSIDLTRYETAGEPDIRTASLSPDRLSITSTFNQVEYYSVDVTEYGMYLTDPSTSVAVDIAAVNDWNSVYGTVLDNSASWSASGVDSATVSAIASSYAESAASSKLDSSASSNFYLTSNPSGFITGVDLSNYATTSYVDSSISGKQDISGMTAYQPSGDYIYVSALGWAEVV